MRTKLIQAIEELCTGTLTKSWKAIQETTVKEVLSHLKGYGETEAQAYLIAAGRFKLKARDGVISFKDWASTKYNEHVAVRTELSFKEVEGAVSGVLAFASCCGDALSYLFVPDNAITEDDNWDLPLALPIHIPSTEVLDKNRAFELDIYEHWRNKQFDSHAYQLTKMRLLDTSVFSKGHQSLSENFMRAYSQLVNLILVPLVNRLIEVDGYTSISSLQRTNGRSEVAIVLDEILSPRSWDDFDCFIRVMLFDVLLPLSVVDVRIPNRLSTGIVREAFEHMVGIAEKFYEKGRSDFFAD